MKRSTIFLLLFLMLVFTDRTSAQIQLTLTLPELGSPYLSDYISHRGNRLLTITNLTAAQQSIYLHGKIENITRGYYIKTKDDYTPFEPIVLNPHETKVLFAQDRDWDFIGKQHLEDNLPSRLKQDVMMSGILPEGDMSICIRAVDYNTGRQVSPEEPAGCLFFTTALGTPPQIIYPAIGETILEEFPMISWIPAIITQARPDILYDLYVVELTSRVLNPEEVIEQSIQYRGGNPFVVENLRQTFYQFLPGDLELKKGSRYAVVVVAKDSQGSALFENNGRSEIVVFEVGSDDEEEDEPVVIAQPIDPGIIQLPPMSQLHGQLLYRFYEDATSGLIIPQDMIVIPFNQNNLQQLQSGKSVQNKGFQHNISNPGGGNNSEQMSGFYDLGNADFSKEISWIQPGPPQYMLPSGYNLNGGKPLKQTKIRFTARLAVGKKAIIQHPEDLQFVGDIGVGAQVTGSGVSGTLTIDWVSKVIATTTTDDNGNYSVSFLADETFGVLASGPVTVHSLVGDIATSTSGHGLYRVITMEVEDKWYCHPDVVIFMQPGQSLEVPTQVVTVQSYKLRVQVVSKAGVIQAVGDGDGIPGAVVRLGRKKHLHDNAPASFPINESRIEEFGHLGFDVPYKDHMVADSGRTNSNGYVTFHRLVKHSGMGGCDDFYGNIWPSDGYYLEAFSHPTEGFHNYARNRITQLAPCGARLMHATLGCYANECAPRSADYTPPVVEQQLELVPQLPKLYVNSRVTYNNVPYDLPETNLMLIAYDKDDKYIGYAFYNTDHNGLFTKQFLYPHDIHNNLLRLQSASGAQKAAVTSKYIVDYWKPGFKKNYCINCGTNQNKQGLQYGQKLDVEPFLLPGSYVRGIVEDEHGQPIYGDVKIGDGPFIPLEMAWQADDSKKDEPPFQPLPPWFQQFGSMQQQSQSMQQAGGFSQTAGTTGNKKVISKGGFNVVYQPSPIVNPNFKKVSRFRVEAQHGANIRIIIDPDATNYFADTVNVNIPSGHDFPGFDLGTFVIKERLHRPRIVVVQEHLVLKQGQFPGEFETTLEKTPVQGAKIELSNLEPKQTNMQGVVEFVFGSPSEEFRLRVNKDGYVPYDQYVTIPVSKEHYDIEVVLYPQTELSGTVARADGGEPIEGARVYTEIGSNDYGPIILETYTDSTGHYQLTGLPKTTLTVKAAKTDDPAVTYIGKSDQINLHTTTIHNFQLQEAPFLLTHIWNLPVDLETVAPSGNDWLISGAFVDLPQNDRFRPRDETVRLSFKDLVVKEIDAPEINGKPMVEPVSSNIKTTTTKFSSVLNEAHIIEMSGPKGSGGLSFKHVEYEDAQYGSAEDGYAGFELIDFAVKEFVYNELFKPVSISNVRVVKDGSDNGHVRTRAFLMLEYFRFTYQYDGQFYLGENPEQDVISAYKGTADMGMPEIYYLMTDNPWLSQITTATAPDFYVHNFPTVIDRYESYAREDSLVLATKLIVDLPLSNPEELIVSTGDIVVLPEQIIVNEGNEPLEFDLETWKVKTGPWSFDENQGGIVTYGMIRTNLLDIPAPHILIKPDELKLPAANDINLSEITLAGVLDLEMKSDAKLTFGYVTSTAHDPGVGRWRVVLSNQQSGKTVAAIKGLPGWSPQTEVGINFIENFSDGFEKLSMAPDQVVNHYNVIKQTISNIYFYQDGVSLYGNTDLEIPNLSGGHGANFVYYREQNEIKLRVLGLNTIFETKGKVTFQGDQQAARIKLDWDYFDVTGDLIIYDDNSPNIIELRAKLIKTNNPYDIRIKIIDVDGGGELEGNIKQTIVLGGGQNGLKRVLQGEQVVAGNDWDLLSYQARMEGFGGGFEDGGDVMWYKVAGAILNDASKGETIQLANIETPFGDIAIHLDFNEMAFVGALNVYNIPMGTVYVNQGAIEMRVGGLGFYLAGHLSATYPVIGLLNTNFIVGYYPVLSPQAKAILKQEMYIQKLPDFLENSGIAGLYMSANKPFLNTSWGPIVFPIGYIEIYANAGIDARFWFNFGDDYGGASLGGLAYADFGIGGFVFPCEACAGVIAELGFDVEFQWVPETDFSISACGAIGLYAYICDLGFDEAARLDLAWSSSGGFDVGVTLGSTCSGNALKGDKGCN